MYDYVINNSQETTVTYVLIDEVQTCKSFEWVVNGLHSLERFRIFITGSNAFLLSNDLATLFTGRTFDIQVFPFSFSEYSEYYEIDDIQKGFDSYLKDGGMAGSYLYEDKQKRYEYIRNVYMTLIVRDVKQKFHIRNSQLLNNLTSFLIDNISNLESSNSIADALIKLKHKTNNKTIGNYLEYLTNAFLFYRVRRYDIRGKMYLSTQEKYYLADHAFKYALLGLRSMDYGRVLENIVAIELLRRGYEIYAGQLYQKEIDFVAMKRDEKLYIQVSYDISEDTTFQREVAPLFQIRDAYPKMLLARTRQPETDYEGVRIVDIAEWLLSD